jgi:hypothetical protein
MKSKIATYGKNYSLTAEAHEMVRRLAIINADGNLSAAADTLIRAGHEAMTRPKPVLHGAS